MQHFNYGDISGHQQAKTPQGTAGAADETGECHRGATGKRSGVLPVERGEENEAYRKHPSGAVRLRLRTLRAGLHGGFARRQEDLFRTPEFLRQGN